MTPMFGWEELMMGLPAVIHLPISGAFTAATLQRLTIQRDDAIALKSYGQIRIG